MKNHDGPYTHYYRWKKRLPHRTGQRCRIITRGSMNTVLIEFDDGDRTTTSRHALRRLTP